MRAAHRPPGPPGGLVVSDVSDTGATLQWNAAAAGSRPIVGYRIYRDGNLVEQVAGLRASLSGLASATRYRLTVAAVDSLGYVGPAGAPVDVDTGHVPPGTPTGLTAGGVTDSARDAGLVARRGRRQLAGRRAIGSTATAPWSARSAT